MRSDKPQHGESLVGFLRRLGNLNAFAHVSEFYNFIGKPYGRPMLEDLEALADSLHVDEASPRSIAPRIQPCEPSLEWRFQRSKIDPVCPSCMAEGKVWQQHWRHNLVSACAIHEVRLIDQCPRCKEIFTTNSGGFKTCECGFGLESIETDRATHFEVWIAKLIAGKSNTDDGEGHYGPWLNEAPHDIGAFLFFLASFEMRTRSGKEGKAPIPINIAETRSFVSKAEPWFRSWPHGFQEMLAKRLSQGDPNASSAPACLGNWYQRMIRFKGDAYDEVQKQLSIGIAEHFSGPYAGNGGAERSWISATEAARILSVRGERIVAAVAAGQLQGQQSHSGHGHKHTMLPRAVVETLKFDRKKYLTAKSAMELLGVGKSQFRILQDADFVTRHPKSDLPPLSDGHFSLDELEALIANVRLNQDENRCSVKTIRFSDLNLRRTTQKSKLIAVFKAIQTGKLRAVSAPLGKPLGMFEFAVEDIDVHFAEAAQPGSMTAHQVADITGWKPEVVTHWCKEGLLKSTQSPEGKQVRYLISPKDLSEFQRTFIPLADLARDMQTSSRVLRTLFKSQGALISGEKTVGNTTRGSIVRIADILLTLSNSNQR